MKTIALAVVLVVFTAMSTWLTIDTGYLAWIRLCAREPWALQLFVDLAIACSVFRAWMIRDARALHIRAWPFVIVIATAGSIGILGYMICRRTRPAVLTVPA